MKCSICGKTFDGYGNNPYPICDKDDFESRCCDSCNATHVIQARMAIASRQHLDKKVRVNDLLVIFYSKNSESPIEVLRENGRFLAGKVTEIDTEKNTAYGEWGNFGVDLANDSYIIYD